MNNDEINDLVECLLKTLEASIATDDMILLFCTYLQKKSPDLAIEIAVYIKQICEIKNVDISSSFLVLAEKIQAALTGEPDLFFQSLRKFPTSQDRQE